MGNLKQEILCIREMKNIFKYPTIYWAAAMVSKISKHIYYVSNYENIRSQSTPAFDNVPTHLLSLLSCY